MNGSSVAPRRTLDRQTRKDLERVLKDKHAELVESIRSLASPRDAEDGLHNPDLLDSASEVTQDKIHTALVQHLEPQLTQVRAALERLAKEEYGFCRDCHDFIGVPRLRALPFAQRCTPCQSRVERKGARAVRPMATAPRP